MRKVLVNRESCYGWNDEEAEITDLPLDFDLTLDPVTQTERLHAILVMDPNVPDTYVGVSFRSDLDEFEVEDRDGPVFCVIEVRD